MLFVIGKWVSFRCLGRKMALAVSRRPLIAEARGRFWAILITMDKVAVEQVGISSVLQYFAA